MSIGFTLFVLTIFVIGGILLQIFLSRRTAPWPGLILPAITFLYSLIGLLSVALFGGMTPLEILIVLASTFLIFNLPTLVLLGIYFVCRGKNRRKAQLGKMNIQDLE